MRSTPAPGARALSREHRERADVRADVDDRVVRTELEAARVYTCLWNTGVTTRSTFTPAGASKRVPSRSTAARGLAARLALALELAPVPVVTRIAQRAKQVHGEALTRSHKPVKRIVAPLAYDRSDGGAR